MGGRGGWVGGGGADVGFGDVGCVDGVWGFTVSAAVGRGVSAWRGGQPERSEGSGWRGRKQIPRCARDDRQAAPQPPPPHPPPPLSPGTPPTTPASPRTRPPGPPGPGAPPPVGPPPACGPTGGSPGWFAPRQPPPRTPPRAPHTARAPGG